MTPEQIGLVERAIAAVDREALAADFYRRALDGNPALAEMFTTDPVVQRQRFGAELETIVTSIRNFDGFVATTRALGRRHRGYGVHAAHYALMGDALLGALEAALAGEWSGEMEQAWRRAYNLTAEAMLAGAEQPPA